MPPLLDSFKEALKDRLLIMVAGLAVVSLIVGMIQNWRTGWIQGVSILFALLILTTIASINDWNKDR